MYSRIHDKAESSHRRTQEVLTRKALMQLIRDFIATLRELGFSPERVVLFGSYAKGNPHKWSDVDVAVWDKNFYGEITTDYEIAVKAISRHSLIELHGFCLLYTSDAADE